jgi:flagellar hook protein FlgE
MFTAFTTALSALDANEMGIDVAGNNLANMNTTGYKNTMLNFSELMGGNSNAGATQVGMGVASPTTRSLWTNGALQPNAGPLTAAIQGNGFFTVQDPQGNVLYTRSGNFKLDAKGNLLTQSGDHVLGMNGAIQVTSNSLPPTPTTSMTMSLNLNSSAAVGDTFSQPIQVVDSLGQTHVLTTTFTKTANNAWSYASSFDGTAVAGSTGNLTFNPDGTLATPTPAGTTPPSNQTINVTGLADGAGNMNIGWDFYGTDNATSLITQNAGASASSSQYQNGAVPSSLNSVSIADGGFVVATYDNGVQQNVGQLEISNFENPDTLIYTGNNEYRTSGNTSTPSTGVAGTGGRGTVVGGSLEGSNVDMATEFSNLIIYQRGYEAGTRVLTTADQLSQDTINLIRE